ncbi:MAG TPA: purine-nucleoside phosphorylase [bacterium]|nr:purine-nucleoside phosphorylase [bacterium]HPQ66130.1 purine-nucleoside phosphorylase [bacterium]
MIISKDKVAETIEFLRTRTDMEPEFGLILGSGLGGVVDMLENPVAVPYAEIPNFPVSTVKGHPGTLTFGTYAGKTVVTQVGRVHYYEGIGWEKVMYPLWVMKALGVKCIINTNSAGGINHEFRGGDLMLVTDHINCMGSNPLIGPNDDKVGPRFPDMSKPYDAGLSQAMRGAAEALGIELRSGVLIGFSGPSYETKAEIAMAMKLGADAAGMSSIPEAIVGNYLGMRYVGVTCISNLVSPTRTEPLTHEEVTEAAHKASKDLTRLIAEFLRRVG